MRNNFHTAILILAACILLNGAFVLLNGGLTSVYGQEVDGQRETDSLRMVELYAMAKTSFESGQSYEALNILGKALEISIRQKMDQAEAGVLELIGDIYVSENEPEEAIPYFLRVASLAEFAGDSADVA